MGIKIKVISIIFVITVLATIGIYFGFQKFYFSKSPVTPEISKVSTEMPEKEIKSPISPPKEIKIYRNNEFGFEIQYPVSWTVSEEINENIRGEMVKEFYFKKPNSDLRFAILPRDGLSYGLGAKGTTTPVLIGGSDGMQTQYVLKDGRRLWLIFPRYGLHNWLEDLGRIDVMTSIEDPAGDTRIFEQMLNSFKLPR